MRSRFLRLALAASFAFALTPASVLAADAEKVETLMELMGLKATVAQMEEMIFQSMEQSFRQRLDDEPMSPEQQRRADAVLEVMKQSFTSMLSWEAIGPEYRRIYQDVLTDEEVDGAIAYYRSPAGASMLAKTPELMQRGMELGQRRAQEVMPVMQAQMQRALEELKHAKPE
jgi:hypothetical protein